MVRCGSITKKNKPCRIKVKKGGKCYHHEEKIILGETDKCSICLSAMDNPRVLKCRHAFHGPCLAQWLNQAMHCPYCRTSVTDRATKRWLNNKNEDDQISEWVPDENEMLTERLPPRTRLRRLARLHAARHRSENDVLLSAIYLLYDRVAEIFQ